MATVVFTKHYIHSKTETSITVYWDVNEVCDRLQYSIDGGQTWMDIAGHPMYTIEGLQPNRNYKVMTRVQYVYSTKWTMSGVLDCTTYDYPYCTGSHSFTIGDPLTLNFYNPLGRSITVVGYSRKSGEEIFNGTTSETRLTGFNDSNSVAKQYASIPDSKEDIFSVVVIYNDTPRRTDTGNIYRIRGDEKPTINGFDYIDGNDNTVAVTHDPTKIVQNLSSLVARFHSATSNYGAIIVSYKVSCNGMERYGYKAGSYELGTINSARDVDLTLVVTDSRGISVGKSITVTVLEHSNPNATVTLQRLNNYEDETYLTVDGSVSSLDGTNTMTIQYRHKVQGGGYNSFVTIPDREKQTLTLDKNSVFVVNVVVTDAFGYQFNKEYTLNKGVFPLFIDTVKQSVGINCFPTEEKSLEVNGFNMLNVYKCCKNILLGGHDGLTIKINNFANSDKIPIIIAGADNASMTPVFTVIHLRSGSDFGHISLGLDSAVTRDGDRLHINASQWSYFTVFAPLGADITLSNSAL